MILQCPSSQQIIILMLTVSDLSCERCIRKTASGDAIIMEASQSVAAEIDSA